MPDHLPPQTLSLIQTHAIERCTRHDAAHDALHLQRVVANASVLVAAERAGGVPIDASIVEAACWLHDLVQLPKGEGPPGESARRSADEARVLLRTIQVEDEVIESIAHAIEAHSFSGGMRPGSPEAAIVQDADRLDALGAVGIARLWVTGATMGGLLYHAADPGGLDRELDDRAYGLDHIVRKLVTLPALMNTAAGRVEAARRVAFVTAYRSEFLRELRAADDDRDDIE